MNNQIENFNCQLSVVNYFTHPLILSQRGDAEANINFPFKKLLSGT